MGQVMDKEKGYKAVRAGQSDGDAPVEEEGGEGRGRGREIRNEHASNTASDARVLHARTPQMVVPAMETPLVLERSIQRFFCMRFCLACSETTDVNNTLTRPVCCPY